MSASACTITTPARFLVTGGAGFIGSHLVRRLLSRPGCRVVCLDNFSSGSERHLQDVLVHEPLEIIRADLKDLPVVCDAIRGCDAVFHLAANPDIAAAVENPAVDFWDGTYLTQNVLEAARTHGVRRIVFSSGSGVYGELGEVEAHESFGPLHPISPYGASKLASEALICAYCHMFDMHGVVFRFANVVGPRQTHGVAYDFIRKLRADSGTLEILGDGTQSKSYIHVDDVVDAMLLLSDSALTGFDVHNVATEDYVTVREIADLVCERLAVDGVEYRFTGDDRGWKGDVPVVRFDTSKIRARGWSNTRSSREALCDSIDAMVSALEAGDRSA